MNFAAQLFFLLSVFSLCKCGFDGLKIQISLFSWFVCCKKEKTLCKENVKLISINSDCKLFYLLRISVDFYQNIIFKSPNTKHSFTTEMNH